MSFKDMDRSTFVPQGLVPGALAPSLAAAGQPNVLGTLLRRLCKNREWWRYDDVVMQQHLPLRHPNPLLLWPAPDSEAVAGSIA